ncbi:tetratricopeptide repeat protein [Ignavibacterium sp.]|uniref:tetratricopeptide repeat protein n=1 Tax=Ignavibacterium sp. TaxID=2651167 RepID=UPI00307F310E
MKIFLSITLSLFFAVTGISQTNQSKLLEESQSLISAGRFGEAIELLNRFVTANPHSAEGFNLRGFCYEKRGNYEQAVYDYRTAIRIKPENKLISENLKRAENDWYRLLYNQIEGYKREIAIDPSVAKNYLEIGKCYKNLGEWTEAEIWYDLYLEKKEASADEMLRYTEILAKNNHIQKGESYLKKYVEKYPDDHRLWSRYGYFIYWLGKTKLSENAFLKALEIRPFFKEAIDGLDLVKGKKFFYTFNDTTYRFRKSSSEKVYLIDKYLKSLHKNPDNDELRFKLVEELIKHNRIEEAFQQLELLKANYKNDSNYVSLSTEVIKERNKIFDDEITELKKNLTDAPYNKKSLLRLAELLSYRNQTDEAINYLKNYLLLNDDNDIRFQLAKLLMWNSDLCESKNQLEILKKKNYSNSEADLLLAKIYLWLDQDYEKSEYLFEKYLSKHSENKDAIAGLLDVKLKLQNFHEAENLLIEKSYLFTSDEIINLKTKINETKDFSEYSLKYKLLEEARQYALNGNHQYSIKMYEEFLKFDSEFISKEIYHQAKLELADLYSADLQFEKSDQIYSELLANNYDFEIHKRKAKNIFWSKNYSAASVEFRKLSLKSPDDIETKLFLADALLFAGENDKARNIYKDLLRQSPDSYILNQRLVWLGDKKIFPGFDYSFQLIPSANYFIDNQDFRYAGQSFLTQIALTKNFAIGGAIHRGNLSSLVEERTLYMVKGTLNLRLNEMTTTKASFGQIFFNSKEKSITGDFSLTIENPESFLINTSYQHTDASLLLYSPSLVDKRLFINSASLFFLVYPGLNFLVSTRYQIFLPEDDNQGHQLSFRIGNIILKNFSLGYEFYYYTFRDFSSLYWSPKNFSSHSLWLEWKIFNTSKSFLNTGAKAGFIPDDKFILSEAFIDFNYYFMKNLSFNLYISSGSTYRKESGGYRSFSILSSLSFSF